MLMSMSNGAHISSVSDTGGHSWSARKSLQNGASGNYNEEWFTTTAAALTADAITITYTAAGTFNGCMVFGVSGANTTTPFDRAGALPGTTQTATVPPQASTDGYDNLIIGFIRQVATSAPSAGSGFTALGTNTGTFSVVEYQNFASAQTNLSVPSSTGSTDIYLGITDAIVAADAYNAAYSSKLNTYAILFQGNFGGGAVSKLNSYAILTFGPTATKLITYAVVVPLPSGNQVYIAQ
jgi:hypothetical protein